MLCFLSLLSLKFSYSTQYYTGLQLVLNAETYKYNNFQAHNPPEWKGAVVKVHEHNIEAIVEEGGVMLPTNTLSRLAMKRVCVL